MQWNKKKIIYDSPQGKEHFYKYYWTSLKKCYLCRCNFITEDMLCKFIGLTAD